MKNEWIILLTTCVHVKNESKYRIELYNKQIRKWLNETKFHIFIIESSGYNFNEIKHERLTVYSYIVDNRDLSSSQLEAHSIRYALTKMQYHKKFKECTHIFKVTGRYFLNDIEKYLINITQDIDIYVQRLKSYNFQHTEYYGIRKNLLDKFIETVLKNGLMETQFHYFIKDKNVYYIGPFYNDIPRGGDEIVITYL